jgi:hypothetical protein
VAQKGDTSGLQGCGLVEAGRPEIVLDVDESHPIGSADCDSGLLGELGETSAQRGAVGRLTLGGREDRDRPDAGGDGQDELFLEPMVCHGDYCQVDRRVEVGERGDGDETFDLGVGGVDRDHSSPEAPA